MLAWIVDFPMYERDEETVEIAFPLNGNAQDLLMVAPTEPDESRLRELNIQLRKLYRVRRSRALQRTRPEQTPTKAG
ncbi:hypothetical protein ACFW96_38315 [Streptomyces gardneri]|uniref:hypothetical protein n=1 Tax=Streptomyces gardneri TaxID=66892 RepID=UPI0036AFFBA3